MWIWGRAIPSVKGSGALSPSSDHCSTFSSRARWHGVRFVSFRARWQSVCAKTWLFLRGGRPRRAVANICLQRRVYESATHLRSAQLHRTRIAHNGGGFERVVANTRQTLASARHAKRPEVQERGFFETQLRHAPRDKWQPRLGRQSFCGGSCGDASPCLGPPTSR